MCETLLTKDGIKIRTLGEAHRYGIPIPPDDLQDASPDHCLCNTEISYALAGHRSAWRYSNSVFADWEEVAEDGRTWLDGFDANHQKRARAGTLTVLTRADGRTALTLEEWETSLTESRASQQR